MIPSQALASDTLLYVEKPRLSCASSPTYASFCLHPPLDTHVFQINSAQKLFDLFEVAKSAQKPRNERVNSTIWPSLIKVPGQDFTPNWCHTSFCGRVPPSNRFCGFWLTTLWTRLFVVNLQLGNVSFVWRLEFVLLDSWKHSQ